MDQESQFKGNLNLEATSRAVVSCAPYLEQPELAVNYCSQNGQITKAHNLNHTLGTRLAPVGCFHKLRVFCVGVLKIRALLFGVHISASAQKKLP